MSSKIFNMALLPLFLFEIDIVAYVARHPFLGRSRGFVHLHLAFAPLRGCSAKGEPKPPEPPAPSAEAFAELFFHLLADLIDRQRNSRISTTTNTMKVP